MIYDREQLQAAKNKLQAQIENHTGISRIGIGVQELVVTFDPSTCTTIVPHQVDGVPVRTVQNYQIKAL